MLYKTVVISTIKEMKLYYSPLPCRTNLTSFSANQAYLVCKWSVIIMIICPTVRELYVVVYSNLSLVWFKLRGTLLNSRHWHPTSRGSIDCPQMLPILLCSCEGFHFTEHCSFLLSFLSSYFSDFLWIPFQCSFCYIALWCVQSNFIFDTWSKFSFVQYLSKFHKLFMAINFRQMYFQYTSDASVNKNLEFVFQVKSNFPCFPTIQKSRYSNWLEKSQFQFPCQLSSACCLTIWKSATAFWKHWDRL